MACLTITLRPNGAVDTGSAASKDQPDGATWQEEVSFGQMQEYRSEAYQVCTRGFWMQTGLLKTFAMTGLVSCNDGAQTLLACHRNQTDT